MAVARSRRGLAAAVVSLATLALAFGPSVAARPAQLRPTTPSTVVVALSAMPQGADPLVTDDQYSLDVEDLLYDPLYYETPERTYAPDLAVAWQAGGGGRTYTYVLDAKARWSDGRAVDAADVAASLEAYASSRDHGWMRGRLTDLLDVRAVGPDTVRVRLRRPDPSWPGLLAGLPILPATLASAAPPAAAGTAGGSLVTDGPYRLTRWNGQAGTIALAANTAYFRGAPHVARIGLRVVASPTAALTGLRRGTLQVAVLPPALFPQVGRTAGLDGHLVPGTGLAMISFNLASPLLRQAAVRRALTLAVDRPALIRAVGESGAEVPTGPWPAALGGAPAAHPGRDPAKARRLLLAAGWRVGPGGVRRRAGRALALTLRYPSHAAALRAASTLVARAWRRIGVRVRLRASSLAALRRAARTGGYQAMALGVAFGPGASPAVLIGGAAAFPPRGQDIARYARPEVTALLGASGQGGSDAAPAPSLLAAVSGLLAADPPYLPLWSSPSLVVTTALLQNFKPNPWGPDLYQPQAWILP